MQPQTPQVPEPAVPPVPTMSQPPQSATSVPVELPSQAVNAPHMADDGDLIEKEWVHKIKQIISTTQQDPYQQSQQFSALKADYMQKRYGKIIKSAE